MSDPCETCRSEERTHDAVDLAQDTLLGLLGVLLAALDGDLAPHRGALLGRRGARGGGGGAELLKVDAHAEVIAELVDSGSSLADDVTNVDRIDLELDNLQGESRRSAQFSKVRTRKRAHVRVDDLRVLGLLCDPADLALDPRDLLRRASDGDEVLGGSGGAVRLGLLARDGGLGTEGDVDVLLLADDGVEGCSALADDVAVERLRDREGRGGDVGGLLGHLLNLGADLCADGDLSKLEIDKISIETNQREQRRPLRPRQ